MGGLGGTPLPGQLRGRGRREGKLLTDLWKASQNQRVSAHCLGFDQVAFLDKTFFFPLKTPSPRRWASLSSALSSVNGEGGFDSEPITVVSECRYLHLGVNPSVLKVGK